MASKDAEPRAIRRVDYTPPDFLIDTTELIFELSEGTTRVTSTLSLRRNPNATKKNGPLVLNGRDMSLQSIAVNGVTVGASEYIRDDHSLTLLQPAEQFSLTTVTGIEPEKNTALEGLYRSGSMYCTQCEPEGFRKIAYYLDRPDVMAKFRTTIIGDGDKFPTMLSNGNEIARRTLEDGRAEVVWEDPFPKPAYLFALVAGDLQHIEDTFVTLGGRTVSLRIYTEAHNIDKVDYAMDTLKRSMTWDEQKFGREYDLDVFMIVAVDDFNMGAMENKGLNIFNTSCVLATPDTTTDTGFQRVEAVVGHEYFHNWSGNRVTCRDWFQLSLKEGFTVFRDAEFSADQNSRQVKRVQDVRALRSSQFVEDAGPMAHPVRPDSYIEISNFYTLTVYEKGAEIVRMIQTLLGTQAFRRGCDLYFARHDGQAVTCEDFVAAMEDSSGADLSLFRRWYEQAGTPRLSVQHDYDQTSQCLHLHIAQTCSPTPQQPDKKPMHIPIALGLLDPDGRDMLGRTGKKNGFDVSIDSRAKTENPNGDGTVVVHLTDAAADLSFFGVSKPPVLSFLRDFSAPVKVDLARCREQLTFLLTHDSDGFSRWDAAQSLYVDVLLEQIRAPGTLIDPVLLDAIDSLLTSAISAPDDGEKKALLAEMLVLPSETYLGEQLDVILVDDIHRARKSMAQRIADKFSARWMTLYQQNVGSEPYRPDAVGTARRSLKNVALAYLSKRRGADALASAITQYESADNMTDRLAALQAIAWADTASEEVRNATMGNFYERYRGEPLVIDQWLTTQALAPGENTLATVTRLTTHPAFDARNPNRVRSLIGGFSRNQSRFHATNGSGYHFLAEWVIRLNATNPQVAARLVAPLSPWRRFDESRQKQMKSALAAISNTSKLSPDVYEVVTKSLA